MWSATSGDKPSTTLSRFTRAAGVDDPLKDYEDEFASEDKALRLVLVASVSVAVLVMGVVFFSLWELW
jgi:hypothetical protein